MREGSRIAVVYQAAVVSLIGESSLSVLLAEHHLAPVLVVAGSSWEGVSSQEVSGFGRMAHLGSFTFRKAGFGGRQPGVTSGLDPLLRPLFSPMFNPLLLSPLFCLLLEVLNLGLQLID